MIIDLSGPYPRVSRTIDRLTITIRWLAPRNQLGIATYSNEGVTSRLPVTQAGPNRSRTEPCSVALNPGLSTFTVTCEGIFLAKKHSPLTIEIDPDGSTRLFFGLTPLLSITPEKPPPDPQPERPGRKGKPANLPPTAWKRLLKDE